MARDEFNRALQRKLEPLIKVCGLLLCCFDDKLVALNDNVYHRVHPLRVKSQNSFVER